MSWPKGKHKSQAHKEKLSRAVSGKNHPNWKGGEIVNSNGYILIWNPDHPYSDKNGYIKRSRLVMEQHLGRYLEPIEIVHHKNEIRHDDRIQNFTLFPSKGKHTSFHRIKQLRLQSQVSQEGNP